MSRAARMPPRRSWGRGTRTEAASLQNRHRAAGRCLSALEAPGKPADGDLRGQDVIDLAAQVLNVDDVVRKKEAVHDLVVGLWKDLVQAAAELFLCLLRLVAADAPDHRVHWMVGAAGVNRNPSHAALQHPLREGAGRSRVANEIFGLVHLRLVGPVLRVVTVVAGVDDEDIPALYAVAGVFLPPFEMLWPIELVITDTHSLEVDHACRADKEVKSKVADEFATGQEVRRGVEVSADVESLRYLLTAALVEREPLDPSDGRPGVAGESRRVQGKVLGQVEKSHSRERRCRRAAAPVMNCASGSPGTLRCLGSARLAAQP